MKLSRRSRLFFLSYMVRRLGWRTHRAQPTIWSILIVITLSISTVLLYCFPHMATYLRATVLDLLQPAYRVLHTTGESLYDLYENFTTLRNLQSENQRLKQENATLKEWQVAALALKQENTQLRKVLHMVEPDQQIVCVSRILSFPTTTLRHTLLIQAGSTNGVAINQPVVAHGHVIGRILDVTLHSATVLLLTDMTSRIPAIIHETQQQAILVGSHARHMYLEHWEQDYNLPSKGNILTSGKGGVFPPGLLLGKIHSISAGKVVVAPAINFSNLQFVQVLKKYAS